MQPIQALKPLLAQRGDFSLYAFAKAEDFNYRTVCLTVQRWGDRTDREPHGGEAKRIMARLRRRLDELNAAPSRPTTAKTPGDCP
ncbi:hypothetical protein SAMN02949497_3539 [Methylomagnum ishizawai]|uniref:Uncharacterized protein n=1 Tax=Methylomagnum ishizawai TaxID=1760988 RepID=A0A1Y6D749_9GAMM|nr:hypothetical protein [Methylomagnum ishizawai]SMF96154.1 hypothetical protein SAMN02949497_3539 [Methylomagnum ishizawai]